MDERLKILCNLYDRSDKSINIDILLETCFFNKIEEVLKLLSKKQNVLFAYLCVKSVLHLADEKVKKQTEKCLKLIEKWLKTNNCNIENIMIDGCCGCFVCYAALDAYNIINCNYSDVCYTAAYAYVDTVCVAKNKQEQEYKNLGFLVKVIKENERITP